MRDSEISYLVLAKHFAMPTYSRPILMHLLVLLMLGACGTANKQDSERSESRPTLDSDLAGLQKPRGLIQRTANATPGYILFTPKMA